MNIRVRPGWGDAVPGGYNGALFAEHDGRMVGSLEYQAATGKPGFKIAMIEVYPAYRGCQVASHMLMAARREMPDGPVNPGWMTDDGYRWWQRSGRAIAKHYRGDWSPDGYEVKTAEPRSPVAEPEREVEAG
jgi:GNAT superfamily N-acetyltransferase